MPTHETVARFRAAVEKRDLTGVEGLFAPDARLNSPVKFRPFEGRAAVLALLDVLLSRVFEDFRYVGEFTGSTEGADAEILVFRAVAGGREVHGLDMLHLDAQGRITDLTVMVRPQSAVQALGEAVRAGLTEAGVLPEA
ncbi:nuclear transport factor 2 family protein [Streptomyces sp. NPDC050504]|uniref:nuclear transport factor 2 family protein n=1 Tax=Streptomyces sp. NPDC050504 TaxID=3365618 RepID=UPI0037B3FF7D